MRTPAFYRLCDGISEVLLVFAAVFYPWAFGTTENWSIWIMNSVGYTLGTLLLIKHLMRWRTGYAPPRWTDPASAADQPPTRSPISQAEPPAALPDPDPSPREPNAKRWIIWGLAAATVAALAYCLIGALNARIVYQTQDGARFAAYREVIPWLPHSYDQQATWLAFWSYLGLAFVFWSARDVLIAKSALERHLDRERALEPALRPHGPPLIPERMRRLLWVLCLNGAWLGIVSILQRLEGTDKLLWLMERQAGYPAEFSFGPFAYRGNAAQYFNLLWPVCFGFWWVNRAAHPIRNQPTLRAGSGPHALLLPAAVLMAMCPALSGHLAGGWLSLAALPLVFAVLLACGHGSRARALLMLLLGVIVATAGYLQWRPVESTLPQPHPERQPWLRQEQNEMTLRMLSDRPWLGFGPYAYRSASAYYAAPTQPIFSFAHNDWLQSLVEWGCAGFLPILAAFVAVWLRLLASSAPLGHPVFTGSIAIGVLSLLIHALFDFPLQIQSILFTLVLLLAMLLSLPEQDPAAVAAHPNPRRPASPD